MPSRGRHPQRWLLTAFLGCEFAALLWLLWRARQGFAAGETASLWWAALVVAATLAGSRAWPRAWRAASCRFAGIAPADSAVRILVALPEGGQAIARVVACWQFGGVATVLRLAPAQSAQAAVPGVLLLIGGGSASDRPGVASAASRRALLRAVHASPGPL